MQLVEDVELRDIRVVTEAVLGRELDGCTRVFADREDVCLRDGEGSDPF